MIPIPVIIYLEFIFVYISGFFVRMSSRYNNNKIRGIPNINIALYLNASIKFPLKRAWRALCEPHPGHFNPVVL